MGQIGISVTMKTAFRDSIQEWSNVFHYGSATLNPAASLAETLLDEVVTNLKACHSTNVTFVRGRVWSSGGTIAENTMIFQKNLTGAGTQSTSSGFDKERAYLVQWAAGLDIRGKPVKLKKWFHACGFMGGHTLGSTILDNSSGFTDADRTAIAAKADAMTRIGPAPEAWGMVAESGRERDGGAPVAHKYLEHHQLGDQWRG
jgi:hypothetical protein